MLPKFALHDGVFPLFSQCGQFWGRAALALVTRQGPGALTFKVFSLLLWSGYGVFGFAVLSWRSPHMAFS
jgi:hypothetical protein